MTGKRIGYVDFDLNNFHSKVYLDALRNELKGRGYTVSGCTAMEREPSREWANANNVPWFDDVAALDPHVDYYLILAPRNSELHLGLCEQVFPRGKPTFVDKTFAPDVKTAQAIFALADRYRIPVQTSSALRYSPVSAHVAELGGSSAVRHVVTWGGGKSFAVYAIHPVELAVTCLGPEVERLMRRGDEPQTQLLLDFSRGRTAVVNVYTGDADTPLAAVVTADRGTKLLSAESDSLFLDACGAILDFFAAGAAQVDRAETMAVMRILAAAADPRAARGFIDLSR